MSLLSDQATLILQTAAEARIGIIVKFQFGEGQKLSMYQVTRYLYKLRKELDLPFITMRASPDSPDDEIWLFKTRRDDSEEDKYSISHRQSPDNGEIL